MRPNPAFRAVPLLALLLLTACPEDDPSDPGDPLEITTTALPLASVEVAYSAGIDAEGGDGGYHWELASGNLPPGLELSVEDLTDDDLVITGIPEVPGTFSFVLRVESEDGQRETQGFTITVLDEPADIAIATPVLPPGLVNAPYSATFTAVAAVPATFTWTLESGTLPAGLTFHANGTITGTPTTSDTVAIVVGVAGGGFETTRTFTLQVVANRTGTYDITVVPVVPIPAGLQPAVDAAMERLEAAVTGDLSSLPLDDLVPDDCAGFGDLINSTSVDDLILLVNIAPIDGPSQVLGFAGPCLVRNSSVLPVLGILTLDVVDLGFLDPADQIALVTHETAHVLGYGSLWEEFELVQGDNDPRFTGSEAIDEWNALGGTGAVPLENTGGEGTARSHWRESVFQRELMTGFSNTGFFQPLSRLSIASLADLGYTVDLDAADAFALPAPRPPASIDAQRAAGHDVVLRPVGIVDERGRVTPIRQGNR